MNLGIVAIGRNEGSRLRDCLESLLPHNLPTLYVDSHSVDGSVQLARELGVDTLELDPARPCCASRARREGFRRLTDEQPDVEFVFFVDGDCRVDPQWLNTAHEYLLAHPKLGAVCGRRREANPNRSVYNRLCDFEWDTPVGEAMSVGGDAVYRAAAYREAGEFDPTVPAGEEPELCKRMRDSGWKIWRLDAEMTTHDAAMARFGQWWQRQVRTGYAGHDVERRFALGIFDRIIKSAFSWAVVLPVATLAIALVAGWTIAPVWGVGCIVAFVALVLLQVLRIAWRSRSKQGSWMTKLQFGFFTMLAKLPIAVGAVRQMVESSRGRQAQLVEYKSAEDLRPQP